MLLVTGPLNRDRVYVNNMTLRKPLRVEDWLPGEPASNRLELSAPLPRKGRGAGG